MQVALCEHREEGGTRERRSRSGRPAPALERCRGRAELELEAYRAAPYRRKPGEALALYPRYVATIEAYLAADRTTGG